MARTPSGGPQPHPWLRPLYRRVAVMAVCVAWLVFELFQEEPFWTLLAVAITGYAAWDLFLNGAYRKDRGAGPS